MKKYLIVSTILIFVSIFVDLCLEIEFVQDDTFIFLRFAKNFVNGNGLVFNVGENVEGYSSLLWVLLLSGFLFFKLDAILLSQISSMIFGVAVFVVTYFLAFELNTRQKKSHRYFFSLLPLLFITFSGGFHYWSISGMETTLFVFLFMLSVLIFIKNIDNERSDYKLSLLLFLSLITRFETLLLFGLIQLFYLIYKRGNFFSKKHLKELAVFVIPALVFFTIRYFYYGNLLPNTMHAKTGFSFHYFIRGFEYFVDNLKYNLLFGFVLLLPLLFLKKIIKEKRLLFVFSVAFIFIFVVTLFGGDVLPHHRFYLPVLPLCFIVFSISLGYLFDKNKTISVTVIIISIAGSIFSYQKEFKELFGNKSFEDGLVKKMSIYASFVNDEMKVQNKKLTTALSTIGAFSFYSKGDVIDIIGLTDSYISHNPIEVKEIDDSFPIAWRERHYNVDYVLERKPDFVLFPAGAKPTAYPEAALFSKDEFQKKYYVQLIYSRELNQYLPIFTRREKPLEIREGSSSPLFVKHYIQANNYFLSFLSNRDLNLISQIEVQTDSMMIFNENSKSYAYSILGYTYYHLGKYDYAIDFLEKSIEEDPQNCNSLLYLTKCYFVAEEKEKYLFYLRILKKYSPQSLPNIFANIGSQN